MPVRELGPDDVATARPNSELREITERFDSDGIGAIVVTEDDAPVGIVTDRDVALAVHRLEDVQSTPVEEVMTEEPATIREDEEAMEISRAINEHNVRRFPVVDEEGTVTGIVTLDDLVSTIGEQLENVADTIEVQSPSYSP